ncbi:uncharacterized protein LOC133032977 [Cannabis sativa]|uniref:uncharacterized protein LOC133032977 n=1 Tax=Cannabis sativa TaxID=3483 RepID=UPI0029CA378E|nr:uncharacterized protein LOC133032977 [Cannabis sativa]
MGCILRIGINCVFPNPVEGWVFQKPKEMNQAYLAKWGWNLLTGSQSLCCRILEAKYLKGKDYLICNQRYFEKRACKIIADGNDKRIWENPWISHGKEFYPKANDARVTGYNRVVNLLTNYGDWDIRKLNYPFDKESVSAILKGGRPSGQGMDRWIWTKESNGRFLCKSAYLIQALEMAPHYDVAPFLWNKPWNSNILECHKIMWWCILSKALPIRAILSKRFHLEDVACPLCGGGEETLEHLFLTCNWAFHLWWSFPWGIFPISNSGIRLWD